MGRLDRGLGLIRRMASWFTDRRDPRLLEHTVETLVGHVACVGYEEVSIRHDAAVPLRPASRSSQAGLWPVAGKSTLNRLGRGEVDREVEQDDYDAPSLEALFVDIFVEARPKEIVLDLDGGGSKMVLPTTTALLPAALHLLRPVPARRQAAPRQHRRGRRRGRRGRPDRRGIRARWPKVRIVSWRRFGLLPRGAGALRGRGSLTCSAWRPTRA